MPTQKTVFSNARVLTPNGVIEGYAVVVSGPHITHILPETEVPSGAAQTYNLEGQLLLPGFIDTQVNGGGGLLFNDHPTVEGIATIGDAHMQFGTTGFLPTLISDELDVVDKALRAGEEAIEKGIPGVLGVHIEGPFLNPERRGVHDTAKLRQLTSEAVEKLVPLHNGKTVITLAPEAVSAGAISALKSKGFIICIGHSNASYQETVTALQQGATGFTHLFNAMSQLSAREPGVVGAALEDRNSWCGIIADGHHVSPASLRIALKCKAHEKIMLVTDAMPSVGSDQTQFKLLDKIVHVSAGICRDQNGTLAGTALTMSDAISNIMSLGNINLPIATEMASKNPASFLGIDNELGTIEIGKKADLVVADHELNIQMTYNSGKLRYHSQHKENALYDINVNAG